MGSFQTSHIRVPSSKFQEMEDSLDVITLKGIVTKHEILQFAKSKLSQEHYLPNRPFIPMENRQDNRSDITVMQWNVLSQGISFTLTYIEMQV